MEWLGALGQLTNISATGVLVVVFFYVMTGRLRPQRAVDEIRQDRDVRVSEAKEQYLKALEIAKVWEEAYRTLDSARSEQAKILDELMAVVKGIQSAEVHINPSTSSNPTKRNEGK